MKKTLPFILVTLILIIANSSKGQSIIFVDGSLSSIGNGTTWSNAYNNLQTAIDNAQSGDTIWVKKGVYMPAKSLDTSSVDPRLKSFILKSDIAIYGSFQGTENDISQRVLTNLDSNITILSGDLGTSMDSTDNAYHVMIGTGVENVTLNGLSIRYGNANGVSSDTIENNIVINRGYGGGLYLDSVVSTDMQYLDFSYNYASHGGAGLNIESSDSINIGETQFFDNIIDATHIIGGTNDGGSGIRVYYSNPSLIDVHFKGNACYNCQGGGAMRNNFSNTTVENGLFTNNYVDGRDGGGAVYNYTSNPVFENVRFDSNATDQEAGAVYNDSSNPFFTDVEFINNSGGAAGGGAIENDAGTAVFNNVIFKGNTSLGDGGAIQNWKSEIDFNNVLFDSNHSDGNGGAIVSYNTCSLSMNKVIFKNNSSESNGGALYNLRETELIITNGLFYENHAKERGGAICTEVYMSSSTPLASSTILTNVTITKNSADSSGGGGFDDGAGNSKLRNSIVYGNYSPNIKDIDAPVSMVATAVLHSIIGNEYYSSGTALPTAFAHIHFLDSVNNDFRLDSLSPAIDKGDSSVYGSTATPNLSSITTDIIGGNRIMGNNVDIGAYELCDSITELQSTISLSQNGNLLTYTAVPNSSSLRYDLYYEWFLNNNLVADVDGNQFVVTLGQDISNSDWVSVAIYSSNPCTKGGHKDSVQVVATGVNNKPTNENNLSIYPNPNNGEFTIKYLPKENGPFAYTISDIIGREIYYENELSNSSTFTKDFNLSLSKGLYFITIIHENGNKNTYKFIIK